MSRQDCLCAGSGWVETHGYKHGCPECGKNWTGYPPEVQKRIDWENKHGRAFPDDSSGAQGTGFVEVKGGPCSVVALLLLIGTGGAFWGCVEVIAVLAA